MYVVEIKNGNIKTTIHGGKEKLQSGTVVQGINCINSFSMTLALQNAGFNRLHDYTTLVKVYNENKKRYEFHGRVLNSRASMSESGLFTREATCESYLGFLNDSVLPYVEERNWTVNGLLSYIVNNHNAQVEDYKKFVIGNVDVTDPNDNLYVGFQREKSWKAIEEKLIKKLGGEIQYRVVTNTDGSETIYLDYLQKIGTTSTVKIALSKNMKAISRETDPSAYVTRLIPLGAKIKDAEGNETEQRVEISSVNGGVNYIDDTDGIKAYGIIVGYVTFDDVTTPSRLLTKGENWLVENNKVQTKYSITALDLSLLGLDITDYQVHNYHPVENHVLGINDTIRVVKKNINVCAPQSSTIEVGDNFKTLSDLQIEQMQNVLNLTNTVSKVQTATSNVNNRVNALGVKIDGIEGTFFYIKYSPYADGRVMTDVPADDTVYMGTCSTNVETAPTDPEMYVWCKVKGEGSPGATGADGKTSYLHVKYSDDGKTFTADGGETLGAWIGTYVDFTETDSTTFADYKWKKFTGDIGGRNYLRKTDPNKWFSEWLRWQTSTATLGEDRWVHVEMPDGATSYGYYPPEISIFPTAGKYVFSFDAYSETVTSLSYNYLMTANGNGRIGGIDITPEPKRYQIVFEIDEPVTSASIMLGATMAGGFYIRDLQVERGTVATDWSPAPEDTDEFIDLNNDSLQQSFTEQTTSVLETSEAIIMAALENYVQTSNYEEFRQTVEAQLSVMADNILMNFQTTTSQINNVDGDLQEKFTQLYKYIKFSGETAITIGSGDSVITLEIDNDTGIVFKRNGVQFGSWDGENFYTGNIVIRVNERAQLGIFAFVPRSDNSLSFLKVGG